MLGEKSSPQLIKAISAMESKGQLLLTEMALYPCVLRKNSNQVTVEGIFRANKNGFWFLACR